MKRNARWLIAGLGRFAFAVVITLFPEPIDAEQGLGEILGSPGLNKVRVQAFVTRLPAVDHPVLIVQASVQEGWHIYSLTQGPGGPIPTRITVTGPEGVRLVGGFAVEPPPKVHQEPAFPGLTVETHEGEIFWASQLEMPQDLLEKLEALEVKGTLVAQPCDADSCLPARPQNFVARFTRTPSVPGTVLEKLAQQILSGKTVQAFPKAGDAAPAESPPKSAGQTGTVAERAAENGGPSPREFPGKASRGPQDELLPWLPFTLARFRALVGPQFDPAKLEISLFQESSATWWYLLVKMAAGFLGGILLNVMPCVLPVIGLKLFAFIQQAGESRWKAFWLNVWYSVGLLSVFALLAVLAITLQYGWGHLFRLAVFNVVMAAVVFTMALAFLGIWTIPIPGFVGSGRAVELAQQEGIAGAFFKGVFTTILATPCTGPFMGSALAWAFTQTPLTIFLVFMSVGLGMASPYLLVGAFPKLIRFLPKPGPWMEVFERVMGFVLLGTVLFILTFLDWPYVVPTVGLLFAIWAACWWIERAAMTGMRIRKLRAWAGAIVFVALAWLLLFPGIPTENTRIGGLLGVMESRFRGRVRELALREEPGLTVPGQPNDPTNPGPMQSARGGYTVLVDCTADWCLTCKTLEATVLNSRRVQKAFREKGVVLMKADWTHEAPEVTQFLNWLGFQQVPVIAIFPAGRPNNPIVFTGWYTQRGIVQALEQAGPSQAELLGTSPRGDSRG